MKKVGLIATIVIVAMLIAGCGNSNNADNKTTVNESLAVSSSVGNTENNNSEIVKENQSSTEITTTEPTTAETTTRKKQLQLKKQHKAIQPPNLPQSRVQLKRNKPLQKKKPQKK